MRSYTEWYADGPGGLEDRWLAVALRGNAERMQPMPNQALGSQAGDGRLSPSQTFARVPLRPIGSPLPLGAFALMPAGLLLAGSQLGWFSLTDEKMIPFVLLGFAVPMQLCSPVAAWPAARPRA